MNMFEISYDVKNATTERCHFALAALMSTLVHNLQSPLVRRYVASSLMFTTSHNYFEVVNAMNAWSNRTGTYFSIAQILPNEDGRRYYYTMVTNPELQREIDDLYHRTRLGQLKCTGDCRGER